MWYVHIHVCVCVCVRERERERANVAEHVNACTKTRLIFIFLNLTIILKFMKSVPYVVWFPLEQKYKIKNKLKVFLLLKKMEWNCPHFEHCAKDVRGM
jgi:hypothetical protein